MKIVNIILAILFVLFAFFQLNDPDPILWVSIYLLVAVAAGLLAAGKFYPTFILFLGGVCLYFCASSIPGVIEYITNEDGNTLAQGMSYEYPYIEETREFGGALIALLALVYMYVSGRKIQK